MNKTKQKKGYKKNFSIISGMIIIGLAFFLLASSEIAKTQNDLDSLKDTLVKQGLVLEEAFQMIENRYKLDSRAIGINNSGNQLKSDVTLKTNITCQAIIQAQEHKYHLYYSFSNALELLQDNYQKYRGSVEYIQDSLTAYEEVIDYVKNECQIAGYIIE